MNKVNTKVAKQSFSKPAIAGVKTAQFKIKLDSGKKAFCGRLCVHTTK